MTRDFRVHGHAMLQQEGADLITGTLTDPSFTHAVERLEVNLLGDLRRDELHGRALHRLGDRLGIAEVVLLASGVGTHIFGGRQPSVVAKRCEFAAQVMRAKRPLPFRSGKAEYSRAVFPPCTRPLLAQYDRTALIETYNGERVLTDIDADHGDCRILVGHGVLLLFGAPCQLRLLAGPEHVRTIPLPEGHMASYIARRKFLATLGGTASRGACSNGLGKYELRRMFSPKRETKPASAQHDDNPVMTAYPHCPQSAFHFLEVLIKTAVGQRRAPGSKDRRRVGNTPRLVFQQVRQAEKRNGGPRAEGTFVRHGCHILKT